jgi:hypothetical protein
MEAESPNMENLVVAKKGKGRRWIVAPLKFRRAKVKPSPVREVAVVRSSLDHPSWSHPATSHLTPLLVSTSPARASSHSTGPSAESAIRTDEATCFMVRS